MGIDSKMATRSLLRIGTPWRKSPILALVQRNLATSSVSSCAPQTPEYRPGFLRYIFWIPYTSNPDVNHGFVYRQPINLPGKRRAATAEIMMTLIWWWMLFFCFTEPGHIFGEIPWINPKDYTDEELGIPAKA